MLEGFFHKITIWEYVKKVSAYIRANYDPRESQNSPHFSGELDSEIKYSDRGDSNDDFVKLKYQLKPGQTQGGQIFDFDCVWGKDDKPADSQNAKEGPAAVSQRRIDYNFDPNTKYCLADRDVLENRYDEAQIAKAMKKYSFLDESITLLEALDKATNKSFVDALMIHMRRREFQPSTVYKLAHIDRKLFSKIISDRNYKPSKDTAIAIILALNLTLDEANDMLGRAGYAFSHSNKKDIVIEYFIREKIYNLNDINEVLYKLDEKIIGK